MVPQQPTPTSGFRERLEGWKVVIAIGTAVTLAPVIALALLLVLATALPVLPLLAPLVAGFWWRGPPRPPTSALERSPASVPRPIPSLPSSSFRNA